MNFREAREASGVSQKFVAYSLGVKPPNVSRWEAGVTYPTVENLIKLANLYGVSADYLLGLDDGKTVRMSKEEKAMMLAYRKSDPVTRRAVLAVLGLTATEEEEKITSRA